MQIPKRKKGDNAQSTNVVGYCKIESCGREFRGRKIRKYCDEHTKQSHPERQEIRNQERKDAYKKQVLESSNLKLTHHYTECVDLELNCSLEGCQEKYQIRVFPKQFIYPAFCEKHRNEYKRNLYLRLLGKGLNLGIAREE